MSNPSSEIPTSTGFIQPPAAAKKDKQLSMHGHTRNDPYYWLNDRENPEVTDYLNRENEYLKEKMRHTDTFREQLFEEITGRILKDDQSVPYYNEGYWYYSRVTGDQEYPVYCRREKTMETPEDIILDVNVLAKGKSYYHVVGLELSPDKKLLLYGEDTVSRRVYTLRIKNLETGELLADKIPATSGEACFADNNTIFYTVKNRQTLREFKIFRHIVGTDAKEDVLVFEEKDDTFSTGVYKTKSKKYIVIASGSTVSDEYRVLEAGDPLGNFRIIQPRQRDLEYSIDHFGDHFYIMTNLDAVNFRLMKTPELQTTLENWIEVIPHRPDVLLEGIELFTDHLVIQERKNGLIQLHVRNWDNTSDYYIPFHDPAYVADFDVNLDFNSRELRFNYTSLTTPNSVFTINLDSKVQTLLKQQEVKGGYDSSEYASERLYIDARDGKKVPISLVYKKGTAKDGKAPLLLYAYGSYGYSMDPYFSSVRLSLLDRGFVFAIAHIRGGEDLGREWYEDGKMLHKMNTFNDFIDCGKYLIDNGYSAPDKLFAMGGSAGGLLMGAVANMAPELWKGMVAQVPFVDVVTTMLDESIPLTTGEYDEWGNPNEKEYYDYMLSYSPYDNVAAKNYPAMLVTTGLHDSQVQYWEPAKWVARLRELKTDNNDLLMYCNMDTGHGGASGRFERYKEVALEYAFILDQAGII
ncbi:MAG: S9 family peptidase [Bacteroidota bacterium]